jgi:hypothetical protein
MGASARGHVQAGRWQNAQRHTRQSVRVAPPCRLFTELDDLPSRRGPERAGFLQVGRLRRGAVEKQGQRDDLLLYGLLLEDVTS